MMPLDPPSPSACSRWRAEDRIEVPARTAYGAPAFLQIVQYRFKAHDGSCLDEAIGAGSCAQEIHCGVALCLTEFLQSYALSFRRLVVGLKRDKMPVEPLVIVECKSRPGPLLGG